MSKDGKSSHYDVGGIEVLDVIKAKLTPEQYRGYLLGNAIKYLLRLNHKGCSGRDAEKAHNYIGWLNESFVEEMKIPDRESLIASEREAICKWLDSLGWFNGPRRLW